MLWIFKNILLFENNILECISLECEHMWSGTLKVLLITVSSVPRTVPGTHEIFMKISKFRISSCTHSFLKKNDLLDRRIDLF